MCQYEPLNRRYWGYFPRIQAPFGVHAGRSRWPTERDSGTRRARCVFLSSQKRNGGLPRRQFTRGSQRARNMSAASVTHQWGAVAGFAAPKRAVRFPTLRRSPRAREGAPRARVPSERSPPSAHASSSVRRTSPPSWPPRPAARAARHPLRRARQTAPARAPSPRTPACSKLPPGAALGRQAAKKTARAARCAQAGLRNVKARQKAAARPAEVDLVFGRRTTAWCASWTAAVPRVCALGRRTGPPATSRRPRTFRTGSSSASTLADKQLAQARRSRCSQLGHRARASVASRSGRCLITEVAPSWAPTSRDPPPPVEAESRNVDVSEPRVGAGAAENAARPDGAISLSLFSHPGHTAPVPSPRRVPRRRPRAQAGSSGG